MTEMNDAAWLWAAKGLGAIAGSAISLVYILPRERREAAARFAVGVVCGLVFGGTAGLKIASELGLTRSDQRFVAELESQAYSLDRPNGRIINRRCDAELGDARCGFALSGPVYTGTGAVLAWETPERLRVSGLGGFAAGWFSNGTLTWSSGAGEGRSERITDHRKDVAGTLLVLRPEGGVAIADGDTFTVAAGCDKAFSTCKAKFSNALNFRGFPHLPGNDAAYGYVVDGGVFDGGALVP